MINLAPFKKGQKPQLAMRCGEQAEQDNGAWLYAMFYKNFDSLNDSIAST